MLNLPRHCAKVGRTWIRGPTKGNGMALRSNFMDGRMAAFPACGATDSPKPTVCQVPASLSETEPNGERILRGGSMITAFLASMEQTERPTGPCCLFACRNFAGLLMHGDSESKERGQRSIFSIDGADLAGGPDSRTTTVATPTAHLISGTSQSGAGTVESSPYIRGERTGNTKNIGGAGESRRKVGLEAEFPALPPKSNYESTQLLSMLNDRGNRKTSARQITNADSRG